jgi:hypothetical protein
MSIGLGFASPHQARAETAGCVVVEVGGVQEIVRYQLPPPLEKRGKEKIPKHQAQHGTVDGVEARPSIREAAFASGQSLTDYCDFKVEIEKIDETPSSAPSREEVQRDGN